MSLFGSGHGAGLSSDTFVVFQSILTRNGHKWTKLSVKTEQYYGEINDYYSPVDCVGLRLGGIFDVWLIQQILNAEQNLFDRDRRTPILLLVQQGQANGARGIHVRVE
jgi:hypothetical protein